MKKMCFESGKMKCEEKTLVDFWVAFLKELEASHALARTIYFISSTGFKRMGEDQGFYKVSL